tara:strand:- start:55 stop:2655 length:2601 start_codon:yes stop_codon:yes gene_type:complete
MTERLEEYKENQKQEANEAYLKMMRNLPHINVDPENGGVPMYQWQWDFFKTTNRMCLLTAANQIGKDLAHCTKIPTPNGFRELRYVNIGDVVFDSQGKECRVIDIPWDDYNDTYKITFNDGSEVIAGPNHEWICKGYEERFRSNKGSWINRTTKEIMESGDYSPETTAPKRFSIPICPGVEREEYYLFDPYLIGLLIGDGCLLNGKVSLTSGDKEIRDYCSDNYNAGVNGVICNIRGIGHIIKHFGLDVKSEFKFIPFKYKNGSRKQRLELLQGLMDSDGTAQKNGVCLYYTVSEKLRDDIIELVHSLGGWASYTTKHNTGGNFPSFNIRIKMKEKIFKLERKSDRQEWTDRYAHERVILKIEPHKRMKTKCLTVDSPDSSFLCTKNYIVTHNSSIQIRKLVHWATEPELWPILWLESHHNVSQFWYLYPTLGVATIEVKTKWIKEWLPREEMIDDPQYGYTIEYQKKQIYAIHFNTGVSIYFKSYAQNATDLQSGTVHYVATDEELPIGLYDELKFRTSAANGHFSMAFTATLGQFEWECAMEKQGTPEEVFPKAKKIQVSLFDCLEYVDKTGRAMTGVKTPWHEEKIQDRIDSCSSKEEVAKRIYGRFVKSGGLKYSKHLSEENMIENWVLDPKWNLYAAIDPGSGGAQGHPSGIVFIAVNQDCTEGVVFLSWRGDGIPTTAGDTLNKYIELRAQLKVATQWYDYHAKDFAVLGERAGETFQMAEKSHEIGEPILKTLLKYKALKFVTGNVIGLENYGTETQEGETLKLIAELRGLRDDIDKRQAKDDLIDPTRYICAKIPWAMDEIIKKRFKVKTKVKTDKAIFIPKTDAEIIKERRGSEPERNIVEDDLNDEIEFWNDMGEF